MLDAITHELRWAVRHSVRRPILTITMAATLAVAIGATTTAYGLAAAVLWRPLPFADADRLVFVWEHAADAPERSVSRVTSGKFAEWRSQSRAFTSLSLFGAAAFSMEGADGAAPVRGVRVSASYFDTLGVAPALGRGFAASDEVPGQHTVAILSHALWQQRFGGARDVLGRTLQLSGQTYTIVGVMPAIMSPGWPVNPAAVTTDAASRELWVPIPRTPSLDADTRAHVFGVVGRLAPGVSLAQGSAELTGFTSPSAPDTHGALLTPLREQFVRDARLPLLALAGAALALLLVACGNLAALQVSAFEARRSEIAVRAAVGAGAGRLAGQLLTEALMVGAAGGLAGMLLARLALAALPGLLPPSVPFVTTPALDLRVAAAAIVLAIASALILAAWPVGRLLVSGPAPRGVATRARGRAYRTLVASQVALTVALTVAAALLVQSLWVVRAHDPGFRVDDVVTADVALPGDRYDTAQKVATFEDLFLAELSRRPGIRGIALAYDHPLEANWIDAFTMAALGGDGRTDARSQAQLRIVSAGYFDALGVEVIGGRGFDARRRSDDIGTALVNESFERTFGGNVIGRRLQSGAPRMTWGASVPGEFEIVGVVEDERFRGLEKPVEPAIYLSTRDFPLTAFAAIVRADAESPAIVRELRGGIRAAEPRATVGAPRSLGDILAEQLVARRVTADVIGGFAIAALALAALGLYGLLAMLVSSRTREIGVRLALGAPPLAVARGVLGDGVASTAAGLAAGLILAIAAGRLIEGLLVGVRGRDPATLFAVSATMMAAAVAAAALPALRAARVDAAVVLKAE